MVDGILQEYKKRTQRKISAKIVVFSGLLIVLCIISEIMIVLKKVDIALIVLGIWVFYAFFYVRYCRKEFKKLGIQSIPEKMKKRYDFIAEFLKENCLEDEKQVMWLIEKGKKKIERKKCNCQWLMPLVSNLFFTIYMLLSSKILNYNSQELIVMLIYGVILYIIILFMEHEINNYIRLSAVDVERFVEDLEIYCLKH